MGRAQEWFALLFAGSVAAGIAARQSAAAAASAPDCLPVVQTLYTLLSDDQTEYQIRDRLSFMRFLGLVLEDRVPDAKTLWLYREQLTQAAAVERL